MTYQPARFWRGRSRFVVGQKRSPRAALMSSATRIGVTVQEYMQRIEGGQRWCSYHRGWEAVEHFMPRPNLTGVAGTCREGSAERSRANKAARKAAASRAAAGGCHGED